MRTPLPDEFQDGRAAGSLVLARGCWLELMDAGTLPLPHRFTFGFNCPSGRMALGLTDFLRYADGIGFVRATRARAVAAELGWCVAGTTLAAVWSLPSLEHLFMDLRRAGARYDSTLETLTRLPIPATASGERAPAGAETAGA